MSPLLFARAASTTLVVVLLLTLIGLLQREIERMEGIAQVARAEEEDAYAMPEPEHRYYRPCISCATTVFDAAGNVIDTLPPTE